MSLFYAIVFLVTVLFTQLKAWFDGSFGLLGIMLIVPIDWGLYLLCNCFNQYINIYTFVPILIILIVFTSINMFIFAVYEYRFSYIFNSLFDDLISFIVYCFNVLRKKLTKS